jgi:hypothetical protein
MTIKYGHNIPPRCFKQVVQASFRRSPDDVPGFATLAAMPWYPGKSFRGVIAHVQAAIAAVASLPV